MWSNVARRFTYTIKITIKTKWAIIEISDSNNLFFMLFIYNGIYAYSIWHKRSHGSKCDHFFGSATNFSKGRVNDEMNVQKMWKPLNFCRSAGPTCPIFCRSNQFFYRSGIKSPKIMGNFLSVSRTDKFKHLSVGPNICRSRTDGFHILWTSDGSRKGILFCFETHNSKGARAYWGKHCPLLTLYLMLPYVDTGTRSF